MELQSVCDQGSFRVNLASSGPWPWSLRPLATELTLAIPGDDAPSRHAGSRAQPGLTGRPSGPLQLQTETFQYYLPCWAIYAMKKLVLPTVLIVYFIEVYFEKNCTIYCTENIVSHIAQFFLLLYIHCCTKCWLLFKLFQILLIILHKCIVCKCFLVYCTCLSWTCT